MSETDDDDYRIPNVTERFPDWKLSYFDFPLTETTIRVWAWADAPEELKTLSTHGGDEDWLALIPRIYDGALPMWMNSGSPFGCCDVSKLRLTDGSIVAIGAHA